MPILICKRCYKSYLAVRPSVGFCKICKKQIDREGYDEGGRAKQRRNTKYIKSTVYNERRLKKFLLKVKAFNKAILAKNTEQGISYKDTLIDACKSMKEETISSLFDNS